MKQILDVGQCDFDHYNIQTVITNHFEAELVSAETQQQALELARQSGWDLILVNRILDADGSSGLELIQALKSDPVTRAIPVMLVSNYADAQLSALEVGALPGFGKATLNTPATLDELKKIL